MDISISIAVFILGLIIGSFLNVLILRYNTGRSIGGRSGCLSCGKKLHWYELLPVISFLWQGGRCSGCKSKISWQYPLVELLTALMFIFIYWRFVEIPGQVLLYWLIASVSIFIFAYDWKHKIIPDRATVLLLILAITRALFLGPSLLESFLTGLGFFIVFWALWYFSNGRWLGFGDAKLVLAIGILLGWQGGIIALCLAFWIGAIVGLSLVAAGRLKKLLKIKRRYTIKSELPFAPFLLIGMWLLIFFQINEFFF